MVDGVVTSAHIEGVGVGQEWFCFEGEQLFDESGETGGLYVGGVALFADVDFDGGEVVFAEAFCKACSPEEGAGLFGDCFLAVIDGRPDRIDFRGHGRTPY